MKKRLFALLLCLALLLSSAVLGVGAAADPADTALLPYTLHYSTSDGKTLSELTALGEQDLQAYQAAATNLTLDSSTGLPCQVFEVDTSGVTTDSVLLTVGASTLENERVALKALNVATGEWDTLDTVISAGTLNAEVALADYAENGKLQAMVTLDYVTNGSNRLLWSTDQQHYTEHADLNEFYYKIHEYMVQEYQNDNVAYVINTGDIVDDPPGYPASLGQWKVADEAFAILDEAGVPYGIETGNHDVADYPANIYTNYLMFFGEERYEGKPWYGGTADDNKCHYDLVTVGNVDFLFLYIGYGLGDDMDVINWANDVLAMYPHRNAVICTHQYLSPTTLEQAGRAELIHNTIVTQNQNVKMVLSGHYDGAGYKWRDADGRQVLEVIADYQFVQVENEEYYAEHEDPLHHIGSVPYCNGEGYIREILIEGNTVDMYAFSPVTGGETPFGARDDLTFTVDFIPTSRTLTTHEFAAVSKENVASLTAQTDADGNTVYVYTNDQAGDPITLAMDEPGLSALIEKATAVDKALYTKESYQAMKEALSAAKKAVKNGEEVAAAYTALSNAYGALEEKTVEMDPEKLTTVLDFNLQLPMWQNYEGPKSLDKVQSYIKAEQLENGGFTAKKSDFAKNSWPAMTYVEPITFTPEDGKVYLYLDLEAGSTWSIFPTVIQDMQQYEGRLNYVVEGSYRNDLDAGSGIYKGVYDITQGLVDMGVDPTKEMTITFIMNVVPGPVTVNSIKLLTGEYPEGISMDTVMWIVLAVVIVLAVAAVLFAVLYNPKKKKTAQAEENETGTE